MIDYIVFALFVVFMVFMVRGFAVQMLDKNRKREEIKTKKEGKNEKRIID